MRAPSEAVPLKTALFPRASTPAPRCSLFLADHESHRSAAPGQGCARFLENEEIPLRS
jgi:hypothetical protein